MVLPLGDLHRTRITPVVTYALITINVLVYLVQVQQGDSSPWRSHARPGKSPTTRISSHRRANPPSSSA